MLATAMYHLYLKHQLNMYTYEIVNFLLCKNLLLIMYMKLSQEDYVYILKHYGVRIPRRTQTRKNRKPKRVVDHPATRRRAEKVLATKLCRCIKVVQKNNKRMKEPGAIAVCSASIFKKRGLKLHRFKCKKGSKLIANKTAKRALIKTRKMQFRSK